MMHAPNESVAGLILLDRIKSRLSSIGAAKNLNDSWLWRCRGAYAERSGVHWKRLSTKHWLLAPGTRFAPYDLTLSDLPEAERRGWSGRVSKNLATRVPVPKERVTDLHAGKPYVEPTFRRSSTRLYSSNSWWFRKLVICRRLGSRRATR